MNLLDFIDKQTLILMAILIMFFLYMIVLIYRIIYAGANRMKYVLFGNAAYLLFFIFLYMTQFIYHRMVLSVVYGFFDCLAITLWMIGIKNIVKIKSRISFYVFVNGLNIILLFYFYYINDNGMLRRALTTYLITVLLVECTIRIFKNIKVKELRSFVFTGTSMILYSIFKFIMATYRLYLAQEKTIIFETDYTADIFIAASILFAILINFSFSYLDHDNLLNRIERLSYFDYLTDIPNRRCFMEKIEELLKLNNREKINFAIAIFDIDDFKKINDQYGHQTGDEVLHGLAQFFVHNIREIDMVARYGGEEFVMMLCVDNVSEAHKMLNRMLESYKDVVWTKNDLRVTFSGGVAMVDGMHNQMNIYKIIALADSRLYQAKEAGKNRIVYDDRLEDQVIVNGRLKEV